jgi:hypothetical protein
MLEGCETGVPDWLCSDDLLRKRQACFLDYTTGTKMVGAESAALSVSRMSNERSAVELRSPENWCPQPDSHRRPDA